MNHKLLWRIALPILLLASCAENPADSTPAAQVSERLYQNQLGVPPTMAVRYSFAESSTIGFTGSKAVGASHDGTFERFTGQFFVENKQLVGTENRVTIDMSSVRTDDDRLSGHLRSQDFFDVARYPNATFEITYIKPLELDSVQSLPSDSDQLRATHRIDGNFTLHGRTRGMSFPATITVGEEQILLRARFHINRSDWDLSYEGRAGDDVINKAILIQLNLIGSTN